MVSIGDIVQTVIDTLLASSAVTDLVGSNVVSTFATNLDDRVEQTARFPRIVLSARAGRAMYGTSIQSVVVEISAESNTGSGLALEVYDAAFGALQEQRVKSSSLTAWVVCRETVRPILLNRDSEDAMIYTATGRWHMKSAGSAV